MKEKIEELNIRIKDYNDHHNIEDLLKTQKVVKEYLKDRKNIPRELILKIVDRIEIHQDKTVDLYFKLKQHKLVV